MWRALFVVALVACATGRPVDDDEPVAGKMPIQVSARDLAGRGQKRTLRAAGERGVERLSFAHQVRRHGEAELEVELADVAVDGNTHCTVKVMVLALPSHDLLGIAEGGGTTQGHGDVALADCITSVGVALIERKVQPLLRRRYAGR
jgi:hypothetical protein